MPLKENVEGSINNFEIRFKKGTRQISKNLKIIISRSLIQNDPNTGSVHCEFIERNRTLSRRKIGLDGSRAEGI